MGVGGTPAACGCVGGVYVRWRCAVSFFSLFIASSLPRSCFSRAARRRECRAMTQERGPGAAQSLVSEVQAAAEVYSGVVAMAYNPGAEGHAKPPRDTPRWISVLSTDHHGTYATESPHCSSSSSRRRGRRAALPGRFGARRAAGHVGGPQGGTRGGGRGGRGAGAGVPIGGGPWNISRTCSA